MSVGVMKDYELKLSDEHASHTLGCAGGLEHSKIESRKGEKKKKKQKNGYLK